MKKTLLLNALLLVSFGAFSQTARVQIIHNAPDLAVAEVDVYINGILLLDNVAFRTASPFADIPAGIPLTIDITEGSATSADDSVYSTTETLEAGETYVMVAAGIISPTGYMPLEPLELYVYPGAAETASQNGNTDILIFHGSTDAPTIDVEQLGNETLLADDLDYGEFSEYTQSATDDYTIEVTTEDGLSIIGTYEASFTEWELEGEAVTIMASGFFDPTTNSFGADFGLWAALPQGGPLVQLPEVPLSTGAFAAAQVNIYPNPSNSTVTIGLPEGYSSLTGNLYDMAGRKVMSLDSQNIDVSGLANGIYNLTAEVDGQAIQTKVIKN